MRPSFLKGFKMGIWITGGAWISSAGHGVLGDGKSIQINSSEPIIPPVKEIFDFPLARYGRFDTFTKLGCTAAALALKNAEPPEVSPETVENNDTNKNSNTGMIISSLFEIMETDINYYQTTLDEGGTLSSPNLFSYTLPVIVLGETAVHFKLRGPTFCVGEEIKEKGLNAIKTAMSILDSGKADKMLAGWIDSPPSDIKTGNNIKGDKGAIFLVLDSKPNKSLSSLNEISYNSGHLLINRKKSVSSIIDFF